VTTDEHACSAGLSAPAPAATASGRVVAAGSRLVGLRIEAAVAGSAAAVLGTVAWGFTSIFIPLVTLPGLTTLFYRLWPGAGVLLVVARCSSRRWLTLAELRAFLPAGVLLGADMALFFSAVKLTTIAAATVIGALQPALVLLVAGRWFGERVRGRDIACTLVAIGGVGVVALGGGLPGGDALSGDAMAAGSLLCFTGYWLASKRALSGDQPSDQYTAGVMCIAALVATPVALISGERFGPVTRADAFWLALMTLIPGAGHLLFNWAHHHVDVSVSSVISAANPVVAAVLAAVVLDQRLHAVQWAGCAVGVVAIAAVAARKQGGAEIGSAEPAGP